MKYIPFEIVDEVPYVGDWAKVSRAILTSDLARHTILLGRENWKEIENRHWLEVKPVSGIFAVVYMDLSDEEKRARVYVSSQVGNVRQAARESCANFAKAGNRILAVFPFEGYFAGPVKNSEGSTKKREYRSFKPTIAQLRREAGIKARLKDMDPAVWPGDINNPETFNYRHAIRSCDCDAVKDISPIALKTGVSDQFAMNVARDILMRAVLGIFPDALYVSRKDKEYILEWRTILRDGDSFDDAEVFSGSISDDTTIFLFINNAWHGNFQELLYRAKGEPDLPILNAFPRLPQNFSYWDRYPHVFKEQHEEIDPAPLTSDDKEVLLWLSYACRLFREKYDLDTLQEFQFTKAIWANGTQPPPGVRVDSVKSQMRVIFKETGVECPLVNRLKGTKSDKQRAIYLRVPENSTLVGVSRKAARMLSEGTVLGEHLPSVRRPRDYEKNEEAGVSTAEIAVEMKKNWDQAVEAARVAAEAEEARKAAEETSAPAQGRLNLDDDEDPRPSQADTPQEVDASAEDFEAHEDPAEAQKDPGVVFDVADLTPAEIEKILSIHAAKEGSGFATPEILAMFETLPMNRRSNILSVAKPPFVQSLSEGGYLNPAEIESIILQHTL